MSPHEPRTASDGYSERARAVPDPYHFVDGLDDLEHLVVADLAVAVNVVQLKGPVELVLHLAPARNAQRADELLKVDRAGLIAVEDVEDVVGKRRRVAEREELAVDLLELLLCEYAGRAILQEACVCGRNQSAPPSDRHRHAAPRSRGGGGGTCFFCRRTLVPLLQLLLVKMRRLLQLDQLVLRELGLSVGGGGIVSLETRTRPSGADTHCLPITRMQDYHCLSVEHTRPGEKGGEETAADG